MVERGEFRRWDKTRREKVPGGEMLFCDPVTEISGFVLRRCDCEGAGENDPCCARNRCRSIFGTFS